MKVLFDECVPHRFKLNFLSGKIECVTVPEAGLAGKTNGELLELAETSFDVFVTLDKGIPYQQNLAGRRIAIILIRAKSNRLADLMPHVLTCREALATIKTGEIVLIPKGT